MIINVGLIGYGRYGKKYYANLLKDKYFRIIKILRKSKKKSNDLFTNNKKIFFKIKNIDLYVKKYIAHETPFPLSYSGVRHIK